MLYVDTERCTGCGACVEACPTGAMHLKDGKAAITPSLCQDCEACISACPEAAIRRETVEAADEAALTVPAARREIVDARSRLLPVKRAWLPVLGSALAFVGREIVPGAARWLLDNWDRKRSEARQTREAISQAGVTSAKASQSGSGGRQRQRQCHGHGR